MQAPQPAFGFTVGFGPLPQASDNPFQEVSGLGVGLETEGVAEGGESRFVYRLPKAPKHPSQVLKRGRVLPSSPLLHWCREVLEGDLAQPVQMRTLRVFLLDAAGQPLRAWSFDEAWPVAWEVGPLDKANNAQMMETLQLAYRTSRREDPAALCHPA